MDKRSASILIGCFMCTGIVAVLFLVAYQLSQHSCELILIEPTQHRLSALESWKSNPAKRSLDKTLLLRMSAHLEYNLQSSSPSPSGSQTDGPLLVPQLPVPLNQSNPLGQQQQQQQQLQLPQAQFLLQPGGSPSGTANLTTQTQPSQVPMLSQANSNSNSRQPQQQQQLPMPSMPLMNATNQQQPQTVNLTAKERFLPIVLEKIELERKHNESTFEYKLHMNCSTISVWFVRQADRIRLSQMSLELKSVNHKRSKCDIVLTNPILFEIEIEPKNEGYVHYDCQPIEPLKCIDKRTGDLLAMLNIHALEFETSLKKEVKKKFNYNQVNKCNQ